MSRKQLACDCLNYCGDDRDITSGKIPWCENYQIHEWRMMKADADRINTWVNLAFGNASTRSFTPNEFADFLIKIEI